MSVSKAFMLAMESVTETNQDKAVRILNEAIDIDPECKLAHYQLGMIYSGRGLYGKAINHYQIIVDKIDPKDPGIWFLLARQFHLNGQLAEAIDLYKKVEKLDPLCEKANLYLAQLLLVKNVDLLDALEYANKALNLRTPASMIEIGEFTSTVKFAELMSKKKPAISSDIKNNFDNLTTEELEITPITKLVELRPELIPVFIRHGIRCIGCSGYEDETVKDAAIENHSNLDALTKEIRDYLLNGRK